MSFLFFVFSFFSDSTVIDSEDVFLDSKQRAEWIREGNAAFNAKDYPRAKQLFTRARYRDGLIRLGDYYMYERRLPLLAYGYYKQAQSTDRIADLQRRMVGALGQWLGRDKLRPESVNKLGLEGKGGPDTPVIVHPVLRETVQKILEQAESSK